MIKFFAFNWTTCLLNITEIFCSFKSFTAAAADKSPRIENSGSHSSLVNNQGRNSWR